VFPVGKSCQALNANPEQLRKHVSLSITERRELGCDALNRAMPLAQVHTGHGQVRPDGSNGRGETIGAQCRRQCLRAEGKVRARRGKLCGIPRLELCAVFSGELVDGIRTGMFSEKAQRGGCQFGVVTFHPSMADLGENVCACGPPATATASGGGLAFLDSAVFGEQVEVTANCCGRQPQVRSEVGSGEGAILGYHLPDPVPGARLETVRSGVKPVSHIGNAVIS
jgi:hypothetical protein